MLSLSKETKCDFNKILNWVLVLSAFMTRLSKLFQVRGKSDRGKHINESSLIKGTNSSLSFLRARCPPSKGL